MSFCCRVFQLCTWRSHHGRLEDRLEDRLLRLADRLVDNPISELSASLYVVYTQRVMRKLEDMADFFTYRLIMRISVISL